MNRVIAFLFILLVNYSYAQNLVPNPSFEEYSECPFSNGQLPFAIPWFTPYYWVQSSEYYNMCDSTTGGTAPIYLIQKPRTGKGEVACGFYTSPTSTQEYREYIEVVLKKPLVPNKTYCISYYVSLFGYSTYAIDALCACFTVDSLLCQDPNVMLLPCSNMVFNNVGNIIKDTLNWTKITMSYSAQGGEQFITIGNFKTTPQTNAEFIALTYGWSTYYFIDDVAVYECNTPEYPANASNDACIKSGESVTLGTMSRSEYLYWWYDEQGNLVDTTAQITVYPTQTTTYTLVQKDFKFDETRDTITVTVDAHCNEVAPDTLIPQIRIPNVISPNGDGINDKFVIENGKLYSLKLNIFNRWGNQIFESNDYQNNWPATDIADGVYFYILTSTDPKQEVKEYKGSVSVIK